MMTKTLVRLIPLLVLLCGLSVACKKNNTATFTPSLSFQTTNASIYFPVTVAAVQEVDTLHTTLISGQYSDTSTLQGSISIRVIGDTTATYAGSSVLVSYIDASGNTYSSLGDSTDVVTITLFQKTDNGEVTGSFSVTVNGSMGSLTLSDGHFTVPFLD